MINLVLGLSCNERARFWFSSKTMPTHGSAWPRPSRSLLGNQNKASAALMC